MRILEANASELTLTHLFNFTALGGSARSLVYAQIRFALRAACRERLAELGGEDNGPIVQTDEERERVPSVGQVGERNLSVLLLCSVCRSPAHETRRPCTMEYLQWFIWSLDKTRIIAARSLQEVSNKTAANRNHCSDVRDLPNSGIRPSSFLSIFMP